MIKTISKTAEYKNQHECTSIAFKKTKYLFITVAKKSSQTNKNSHYNILYLLKPVRGFYTRNLKTGRKLRQTLGDGEICCAHRLETCCAV